MHEQKFLSLINRDIDGILTDDEQLVLENSIQDDPKIATLHRTMTETSRLLDKIPDIQPPAQLYSEIMEQIRNIPFPRQRKSLDFLNWVWQPRRKVIVGFSTGLVIGFLLAGALIFQRKLPSIQPINFSTTIGQFTNESFHVLQSIKIEHQSLSGNITFYQNLREVWLQSTLIPKHSVKATFFFDNRSLHSIFQLSSEMGSKTFLNQPGVLQVSVFSNTSTLVAFRRLSNSATSIQIKLQDNKAVLLSQNINIPALAE